MKGIKIDIEKKEIIKKDFLNPSKVYIPLFNYNKEYKPSLKIGSKVKIGTLLNELDDFSLTSSVSGKVVGFEEKTYLNKEKINTVVIENDFKNEKIHLSESDFPSLLKRAGIVGMGGSSFPTYIKYNNIKQIKKLLVNAVECEPFIKADFVTFSLYYKEIFEVLNKMIEILNLEEVIIAIKKTNPLYDSLNKINKNEKIKIKKVPNLYPMGWERTLIKEIYNIKYDKLPIEKNIVVNNLSTIYSIYKALILKETCDTKFITIKDFKENKSYDVEVKIGTLLKAVLKDLNIKTNNLIVAGGPMMGKEVDEDLVISSNLNCVLLFPKKENNKETDCIHCGKCIDICPMGLMPVFIKDKAFSKLNPEKCIECGLCSYICPAGIDLRDKVMEEGNLK